MMGTWNDGYVTSNTCLMIHMRKILKSHCLVTNTLISIFAVMISKELSYYATCIALSSVFEGEGRGLSLEK